ncbi:MAG TPA: HAMP domain-containing protein, partial [Thermoanaerobaculia bacterium]|nr:HAMP domain-containing protein [Thermoanaerobaculia bacterium]
MLKNVKIGNRLGLALGVLLALMAAVAGVGFWGLRAMSGQAQQVLRIDARLSQYFTQTEVLTLSLRRYEKDVFLNIENPDKVAEYQQKWDEAYQGVLQKLSAAEEVATGREDRTGLQKLRSDLALYVNGFNQVLEQIRRGEVKTPQEANAAMSPYKNAVRSLEESAEKLAAGHIENMETQEPRLAGQARTTGGIMALIILAAVLLAVLVGFLLTRSITVPILRVVEAARRVVRGDTRETVEEQRGDEAGELLTAMREMIEAQRRMAGAAGRVAVGDLDAEVRPRSAEDGLGQALTRMIDSQREIAALAEKIAAGDLTVSVRPRSEADVLGRSLAAMVERLSHLIGEMRAGSAALSAAAGQVSSTSQSLSQGTSEQAAAVEETTSSLEQMTSSIAQNADNSRRMEQVA